MKLNIPKNEIKVVLQNKPDIDKFIKLMDDNLDIAKVEDFKVNRYFYSDGGELKYNKLAAISFSGGIWKSLGELDVIKGHMPLQQFIDEYGAKEEPNKELVHGKYNIGDIVVSLSSNRYRNNGDIFEILEASSHNRLYFRKDRQSEATKDWRVATQEEEKAFHNGIKNINDIKPEPKNSKRVVNVTTQQQWDFVTEKLGYKWCHSKWSDSKEKACINIKSSSNEYLSFYQKEGYEILSFAEWLAENSYIDAWNNYYKQNHEPKVRGESKGYNVMDDLGSPELNHTHDSLKYWQQGVQVPSNRYDPQKHYMVGCDMADPNVKDIVGVSKVNLDTGYVEQLQNKSTDQEFSEWQQHLKDIIYKSYGIPADLLKEKVGFKEGSFEDNLDSMLSKPKEKKKSINIEIETKQELNF